jgi:FkbM family methyltransferase
MADVAVTKTIGFRHHSFVISGEESDLYYRQLPAHDLGSLCTYLARVVAKRQIKFCLDIGANIGLSALAIMDIFPEANVMAFEPGETAFKHLCINISSNGYDPVVFPQKTAVGDRSGTIGFMEQPEALSGSRVTEDGSTTGVPITTVDDFLANNNMVGVDFIKIDVEGFEIEVLRGARHTIFRDGPIIMLEYNPYIIHINGQTPAQFFEQVFSLIGAVGVIDSVTGEAELLPGDPSEAAEFMKKKQRTDFDVFDLVNRCF